MNKTKTIADVIGILKFPARERKSIGLMGRIYILVQRIEKKKAKKIFGSWK